MTAGVRWIDAPEEARSAQAAAWLVRLDDPRVDRWLARSPALAADLPIVASSADAGERLVRRRLARLLLGEMTGMWPAGVVLDRTAGGGPIVAVPADWHVSLAGRAPWCAVAVARSPVGIDVEPIAGEPLPLDLLTAAERAWIADRPAADRLRASLACWVAKEAHAKRFGHPRGLDPAAVETQPAGRPRFVRSGDDWSRVVFAGGAACVAAVAVDIE
ncbi:4'-phosphopantetheinyl transferase family protein [uncultured Sphingomonas sp.]|uniref:4'-phosphopantetheinyl transferase family protein n=1 Tax=uncultured Sphingomonas sp. TaxID=158754 RepID=UPI0035CCA367